jgi:hypothetical protein
MAYPNVRAGGCWLGPPWSAETRLEPSDAAASETPVARMKSRRVVVELDMTLFLE